MIKKVEVILTFPQGTYFAENVSIAVYRRFIGFVKHLMCFNMQSKCKVCSKSKECRYYKMMGNNFIGYPGIFIHNPLFETKHLAENEQKKFVFYFIGENCAFVDYVELFFEQLNHNLFNSLFILNEINDEEMEKDSFVVSQLQIWTPIETESFTDAYNKMALFYNALYGTKFDLLSEMIHIENSKRIYWDTIRLKTRSIKVHGYVGKVICDSALDSRLLAIGIGKYNFLGGGQIEIEN